MIVDLIDHPDAVEQVTDWIDTQWANLSGRSREETRARFSKGIERNRLPVTHIALANDKPVGLASLRSRDSFDFSPDATPWICNVFVDENARGSGVADRLCSSLEKLAVTLGYGEVFLGTFMLEGSLYHRRGYKELTRIEAYGELTAVLRKSLRPS
ncbi:MAG: GNAT family N-acetyltransferase [Pseudomonadota bacterium]